jgi:protein-L-isoaspartate(D-aspartate) O-methyltransferase
MTFADDRAAMVAKLRERGISDERTLAAMAAVPREEFALPSTPDPYSDLPLDIGHGQTMSTPWIVATCVAELGMPKESTVLEIGGGSGYGAAVLSLCYDSVITIERDRDLAERARTVVTTNGYTNVQLRVGDGNDGAPDRSPFAGIVVTAMAPGHIPPRLLDQLDPAGTLICPIGQETSGLLVKHAAGQDIPLAPVSFVPLQS